MQEDSPHTFPLYTEVMHTEGKPKAEKGKRSRPEVPQKQLTKEKELNLPTDEDIPTVPQQNLITEDVQQVDLLIEVQIFKIRDCWEFFIIFSMDT